MSQDTAELLKKALTLPVAERADLASSLIDSLDNTQDISVAAAWEEEVERRMKELDSGTVKSVSLNEARQRLTSKLNESKQAGLPSRRAGRSRGRNRMVSRTQ
jgi:putative addiction module component (TIGR02574 family)